MNKQNQKPIRRGLSKALSLLCCIGISLLVTGCVNYDVGVNFNSPNSGKIVQHIRLNKQLLSLDRPDVRRWIDSIESRARQVQGKVKKSNPEELLVTIPFRNGKEFADKYNRLFHSDIPVTSAIARQDNPDIIKLDSQVLLQQNNLVLFERNVLDLSIDLRGLSILTQHDKIQQERDRLVDLEFKLDTSGIARAISGGDRLAPASNGLTKQLSWHLQPGQINHIEAVFWLPNPLGLGAIAIALLMILGFYLKYRRLPGVSPQQ